MLRLWPETVAISLFPGVAWIQSKGASVTPMLFVPLPHPAALIDQLRALLDQAPPLRPGSRVALTVSDSAANIVALPWQAQLQSAAEVDAYARASLEHAGAKTDDGWAMHATFRDMYALGLAYAMPNAWLEELRAELARRNLFLATVLPLSAAIYFGRRPRRRDWPAVVIARERYRHVACIFGPAGLTGYDVEPCIGNDKHTAQRLASRVAAQWGPIVQHAAWIADVPSSSTAADMHVGGQPWQSVQ